MSRLMVLVFVLLGVPSIEAQAAGTIRRDVKSVLAVYWGAEDFPSSVRVDAAIRRVLLARSDVAIAYHAEYLESDRFPEEQASLALREYIRRKYQGRRIDVVVAITDVALQFVLRHRDELFPGAPIVASTIAAPDEATRRAGPGLTGLVSGPAFAETLKLALALHPSTERVFVVSAAPNGRLLELARRELQQFVQRINLTYLTESPTSRLIDAVRAVPPRSLILYVRYSQDDPGHVLSPTEVASLVARESTVPVYGVADSYIGSGVVGGVVYGGDTLGTRLADIASRMLDGTRAKDLPFAHATMVPTFDWRQVQRWDIDPSRLPVGSDIRFREPSALQLYRWHIVGAIVLFALQGFMITSLVLQRARRRDTEARNTAILRAQPDMMFLLTRSGVYIDYHAPDSTKLLAPPQRFIGRHIRDVLPPDLAATFEEHFARLTPEPTVVEYALKLPDGEHQYEVRMVPCNDNEVLSVVREITERKRADAALRDSQERYAMATAAGGVGVWDWNLETNEVYADPSLNALLGYQRHEIKNHIDDWFGLIHPDDAPIVMDRARAHLEGTSAFYEVEYRMLHRDGSIRWLFARGSAVRRDGKAVRIIGTSTDITERKGAEHALREAQAEVVRMSRLTALGEFAASIAHEVSQPLTAIVMNGRACLRWLGGAAPPLNELRAALWEILDASKRANEIIRRNRELFRHHTVQKAPLDINAVIGGVTTLAAARLRDSQVTVVTSPGAHLPEILGDRVELQQVLLNLIVNSIDAMEGLGPPLRRIEIASSIAEEGFVQVSVRDYGVGLEGVDIERMFTPSYTTKETGTGVGLSISRSIVEAHGGRLWAVQNEGCGATFFFTVPAHSAVPTTIPEVTS